MSAAPPPFSRLGDESKTRNPTRNEAPRRPPDAAGVGYQVFLLCRKNLSMLRRNVSSTLLQTGVGCFFLLLLYFINVGLNASAVSAVLFQRETHLPAVRIPGLTRCSPLESEGLDRCFTFVYSPNTSEYVNDLVESMRMSANLTGEEVSGGTLGFAKETDMLEWLFTPENQGVAQAALAFAGTATAADRPRNATLKYTLRYNDTQICTDFGRTCTDSLVEVAAPLQLAVDSAVLGDSDPRSRIGVSMKPFPHPDISSGFHRDAMQQYGSLFLFAAFMFNFIIQLSYIVTEKELRLREAMRQMGLRTSSYWISWFATNTLVNLVQSLLLCITGLILQLDFFTKNSFGLYFCLFFTFATALTAAAFFVSAWISRAAQARNVGFLLFIVLFIAAQGLVQGYYKSDDYPSEQQGLSWVVVIPFMQALTYLISESSGATKVGLTWADGSISPPFYPLHEAIGYIALNILMYLALAWYCDEVVPSEFGVKRGFCFCFSGSYWCRRAGGGGAGGGASREMPTEEREALFTAHELVEPADEDVRREAAQVRSKSYGTRQIAMELLALRKTFGGFTAVNSVTCAVDEGQLVCLLGHNGAGKTTTINMLTGMLPVTAGDATIYGMSVVQQMDQIRSIMGICPQHDVLWDQLSALEHVRLFAGLKGVPTEEIDAEARRRLEEVQLWKVRDVQAGAYSGGMRRRLSLAIALIGDPKIVFCDEPTTGMDPVTRRSVWDMIQAAKRNRVILLTTHSMEEADVLGDRICIMSKGSIQALGTSIRLKQKFGTGYKLTAFFDPQASDTPTKLQELVASHINSGPCQYDLVAPGLLEIGLPRSARAAMPQLFRELETHKSALALTDTSISLATLEEVFLELSRAELEQESAGDAAAATSSGTRSSQLILRFVVPEGAVAGTMLALDHPQGGDPISYQIPSGAVPGSQLEVQVESRGEASVTVPHRRSPSTSRKSSDSIGAGGTSFCAQFAALARKTATYQLRQRCQCACLVIFPIFCVTILIVIQAILNGIDPTNNYDYDCINAKFQSAFINSSFGEASAPSLVYGTQSWLNPHGGPTTEAANLDFPFARVGRCAAAPASCQLGTTESEVPSEVVGWYQRTLHIFQDMQTCQADYAKYLEKHKDVANAASWENEYNPGHSGGYTPQAASALFLQDCQKAKSGSGSSGGGSWKPDPAVVQVLSEQNAQLQACQLRYIDQTLSRYASLPVSKRVLADASANAEYVRRQGMLGRFDATRVPDTFIATFENFVVVTLGGVLSSCKLGSLPSQLSESVAISAAPPPDPTTALDTLCSPALFPTLANLASRVDNVTGCAEKVHTTEPRLKTLLDNMQQVCWVHNSLDALRNISFSTYPDANAIDDQLYATWYEPVYDHVKSSYVSAYAVESLGASKQYDYVAWYNKTGSADGFLSLFKNGTGQTNWFALISMFDSAIVGQVSSGRVSLQMSVGEWPAVYNKRNILGSFLQGLSIIDLVGGFFFPFVLFMLMPIIMSLIMYEKENRLREIMKMMGLKMSVYWLVTYILFFLEYVVLMVVFWVAGAMVGLNFFTLHSPSIIFAYLFIWGHVLIAFSMMLTVFFSKTRTAVAVGFILIFAFVFGGYMVFETLSNDSATPESAFYAWQWLPPMAFMRATVFIVNSSSRSFRVDLSNWHDSPLPELFGWLVVEWFACLLIMYYCEKVLSVGYGVRSHPLFCISREFWCKKARKAGCDVDEADSFEMSAGRTSSLETGLLAAASKQSVHSQDEAEDGSDDVAAEARRVRAGTVESGYRVRIDGLRKVFPSRGGAPEKIAVDNVFLGVAPNECLGLLGPNGAGKTTTISMMCGLFEPSGGNAFVGTKSIRDPDDLQIIHQNMGVCPQHDVLWEDLTAREHLRFYGRLKGLVGKELQEEIDAVLEDVKLSFAANRRAGTYSGGMKRRLSVANTLIGSPRVVYLDEPSTGLDPSARRTLWDCITAAKGDGKSIVLTTHSMEEADALCDRLSIMARGKVRCVGKAAELKLRFGAGYTFTMSVDVADDHDGSRLEAADQFVRQRLFPSANMLSAPIAGAMQYEVANTDVDLSRVFEVMEDPQLREDMGIIDWGITETTLEECFLKITRRVHAEEDGLLERPLGRSLSSACRNDDRS